MECFRAATVQVEKGKTIAMNLGGWNQMYMKFFDFYKVKQLWGKCVG